MLIILSVVIIICTICIYNKIDEFNRDILDKVWYISVKVDSVWAKLDNISHHTSKLQNVEDRLHKMYLEWY